MLLPAMAETGVTQDRVGSPSTWTVQAPHCEIPQPYFVPVNCSVSRKTQSSGVSGLTSTVRGFPFTWKEIEAISHLSNSDGTYRAFRTAPIRIRLRVGFQGEKMPG
jgi:hypothetical protein